MTSTPESCASEKPKKETPSVDVLTAEYEDVGNNWRFFIGLRATTFGAFITVNSTLLAATGWILGSKIEIDKAVVVSSLAAAAGIFILAIALTEFRIWRLFQVCLSRGLKLEELLSIEEGQYYLFRKSERRNAVITYTRVMVLIYALVFLMWLIFFFYSDFLVETTISRAAPRKRAAIHYRIPFEIASQKQSMKLFMK